MKIVAATFPSAFLDEAAQPHTCIGSLSDGDKLACDWREINRNLEDIYLISDDNDDWSGKVTDVGNTSIRV